MKNITNQMIFSRDTNFKDKIQAIFNSPELYEAEGLDDLMNNASKTKCPFYKSSRSLNKKTFLENKPYMFYFSEGALIRNNFLFGELKKEENSEYIYKLNVRDNKKSLDINVFDWAGLYFAKQKIVDEGNLEYLKETCPTQYLMLQEEKLSAKQTKEECEAAEMSFFIILNPNKRAEFERLQKELIIEEKLVNEDIIYCLICWEPEVTDINPITKMQAIYLFNYICECDCNLHPNCFLEWATKTNTCPICREPLTINLEMYLYI